MVIIQNFTVYCEKSWNENKILKDLLKSNQELVRNRAQELLDTKTLSRRMAIAEQYTHDSWWITIDISPDEFSKFQEFYQETRNRHLKMISGISF